MPSRSFVEELEFDLPSALIGQLVKLFGEMPAGVLNTTNLSMAEETQGVYQLFMHGELVYIGKTDSDAGLKNRLIRHSQKIASRQNLDPQSVTFKAVRIYVFTAMDLEALLIDHYKKIQGGIAWQHSGFGANDPGRQRDTSKVKGTHFDALYPIDLNVQVQIDAQPPTMPVSEVLQQLKQKLNYLVRFEGHVGKGRAPHPDLTGTQVTLGNNTDTVQSFLIQIKAVLGIDWQITVLPGYVILYKEKKNYPSAMIVI